MYADISDLKKYMPAFVIEQFTDDDSIGEINVVIVNEAIDRAQKLIDGFLKGRYPDDMADADVPELITDICVKLTAYNLYSRKLITTLPDTIKMDYQYCLKQLKAIQSGKITPFPAIDEPVIFKTNKVSTDRVYTSDVWSTY